MVAHGPLHLSIFNPVATTDRCPSPEIDIRKTVDLLKSSSSSTPSPSTSQKSSRRRVHFSDVLSVRMTIAVADYSDEEAKNSWYKKPDFKAIKQSNIETVRSFAKGMDLGNNECFRGLEPRTSIGFRRRRDNKAAGRCVVMEEQERQLQQGIHDDEAIAERYFTISIQCAKEAFEAGARDQTAAFLLYAG